MYVHRSNRAERLVERIAELWSEPGDPFGVEHLVVQSDGMAQWVKLEVARRRGVVARVEVQRPRELLEHVMQAASGRGRADAWRPERLRWAVLGAMAEVEHDPDGPGPWLRQADVRRRFQLAGRVARLFDQYAVYRPDEVLRWEAGESDAWQARLWRAVVARVGGDHAARLAMEAARALGERQVAGLPRRVVVLGVSSLPPLFLGLLEVLSSVAEVHLMVLAPSQEFHAARGDAAIPPLLAALGDGLADQQHLLEELDGVVEDEALFEPPPQGGLLRALQADMLELRRPRGERVLEPGDRSVQVLACHSPVREVEAARDAVWELLEADPTLSPRDVVWLTPDMSVHGPVVEAVLGVPPDEPMWLPWSVADRPLVSGNASVRALLAVLALRGGRCGAGEVLALLDHPPLRQRFGFVEAELDAVVAMVAEAGVRWGRDAAHRAARVGPGDDASSWQAGLDRLLLGVALGGADRVCGRAPVDGVRGEAADRAGRLAEFVESVLGALAEAEHDRSAAAWSEWLRARIDDWLAGDEERAAEVRRVREVVGQLGADAAGFDVPVPLDVVAAILEAAFTDERRPGGFLRGGMTVGELRPMRAVPFRVVVLLGMSDGVFPRADLPLDFDRMAEAPRRGDRSRAREDRTMFLEALLSARDALVVTSVARSVRTDAELPPSAVVHALLDAIDEGWAGTGGRARDQVVRAVPLQPFSAAYSAPGRDGPPRAADRRAVAAAARLATPPVPLPLWGAAVPAPDAKVLRIEALARFLRDPVEAFLTQRLGLRVVDDEPLPDDLDPVLVDADPLERWAFGDRWLQVRLRVGSAEEAMAQLQAAGFLPSGSLVAEHAVLGRRVEAIAREVEVRAGGGRRRVRQLDLPECGGLRVVGRIGGWCASGRLEAGFQRIDRADPTHRVGRLAAHLGAQVFGQVDTVVVGRGADGAGVDVLPGVDRRSALRDLEAAVALWGLGMTRPLRVSPAAAVALAGGGALQEVEAAHRRGLSRRPEAAERWARTFGSESVIEGGDVPDVRRFVELAGPWLARGAT